ncbi:MAG: 4-aminobutyrate--2-oxoglutarate transaminase [Deltaproteobacteria bacterium]|uniref:4-aminobutyrate--2-oxoglutarate transaminase n=1 Tax=Desulfobacula sp. TaxID=2593537 RepID=UPI0019BA8FC3|nr:4-aminobutyrate--2-oxoglutarate transaminase [Candidatus Desulfobacula maris]MBL6995116.1 4-aminobutyrate--2-oxoglutarate transaminase [Desulfobacula sp.]
MNGYLTKETLTKIRQQYMANGFASARPCYVKKAKGALVWDMDDKEYIDFAGGIAVMNVGHSHPAIVSAVKDQAEDFMHTCFMVLPYDSAIKLAQKLCTSVPGTAPKKAMFANSGAEAVENAIKIARYYTKRTGIIALESGFHGRTLMGMSLTSKAKPYKLGFGPFAPETYRIPYAYCYRCPFDKEYPSCDVKCADHMENFLISHTAPETTAAFIAEPIPGEGGYMVPPPEYFPKLKAICEKHGILFIADEIQTGMGRTGTLFAMEHWGVEADITTTAKSLAAGMPLSAVVGKAEIMDSVHPGGIGGTYGANPLACRAALAVFDVVEKENLLEKGKALGDKLLSGLKEFEKKFDIIGDVRGMGPLVALELVKDRKTKQPAPEETKAITDYCFEKGLILLSCGTYGNVLRFMMPLVTTDQQMEKGMGILLDAFGAIANK